MKTFTEEDIKNALDVIYNDVEKRKIERQIDNQAENYHNAVISGMLIAASMIGSKLLHND